MTTSVNYDTLVQELYIAYFGRPADYTGLQNFNQALANAQAPNDPVAFLMDYALDPSIKPLVDAFGNSKESATLYGSGSTESFVNAIFTDLFNRPAAVSGLAFWTAAIDSGQVSKGLAALSIMVGAISNDSAQGLIDQQTVANKVTVAEAFTTALGASSTEIVAYSGAYAAAIGRNTLAGVAAGTDAAHYDVQATINGLISGPPVGTYNLTGQPESVVGGPGNNFFYAILNNAAGEIASAEAPTLVSGDSITAGPATSSIFGSLNNVLNLADFGLNSTTTIPAGVTIIGMSQVNIQSLEAVAVDFSNWQGLNTINVRTSSGDDTITAGTQAKATVTDTMGNVSVQGASDVTVATDNSSHVTLASSASSYAVSVGDSTNSVTDITVGVAVKINAGAGANTVTLGAGASGTVSFAAHTAADTVVLAPSETDAKAVVAISGLNNSGSDAIRFSGDADTLVGFTQVTAAAVTGSGGNADTLAAWVQAADGAQGSGVGGAAHTVTWFVFQGNTYLLESAAGQSADAGSMPAANTLAELTGTGYTFAHAGGANGTLHLLG